MFVFIQKKKIHTNLSQGKFQKFGLFDKDIIQTDLDRFNQDVQCGYILFK